jgi:6-phosphogluconolactonase
MVMALSSLLVGAQAGAATFVYVSNAEDGDIGMYTLQSDGSLQPGPRFKAEKVVMPMTVAPDKRFLIAAVRSKPFSAYTYSIDRGTGALKLVGTGPLAESFPYIYLDRTARFMLGASYGAHLVSVNPVGADGASATDAGDPDRAQRARDPHRQHQPLRLRAAPRHRPGLPVPVRREERPARRQTRRRCCN